MDQTSLLLLLGAAALIGIISLMLMTRRQRRDTADATRESPYATSTEGQKRCPNCGMFNQWTDRNCIACGRKLPG